MSKTEDITCTVDWARIHAACTAVDHARRAGLPAHYRECGYDGVCDAFGGSYYGAEYERRGLAGLAAIDRAGIRERAPRQICEGGDVLHVTGLRWLAGERRDAAPIPRTAAQAFAYAHPDAAIHALRGALAESVEVAS